MLEKSIKTTKNIKVGFLLLHPYSGRGGTEQALVNLVKGLQKLDVDVTVFHIAPFKNDAFLNQLPNVIDIRKKVTVERKLYKLLPPFVRKRIYSYGKRYITKKIINRLIAPEGLDALIILDFPYKDQEILDLFLSYKENSSLKVYSWIHTLISNLQEEDRLQFIPILQKYDGHFAVSQGVKEELETELGIKDVTLLYNPVPKANLITREVNRFLYIGRITPIKQVPELLDMLKHVVGEWTLDIYGTTGEPQGDRDFKKYIEEEGLSNNVIFHGWSDSPWDNINRAGILLLNSQRESFGLVLVEAMMRGIPCISSNCPTGPQEIIKAGKNGWLFPLQDTDSFVMLINDVLDGTLSLPEQNSIQLSVSCFESEKVAAQFINKIISDKNSH